MNEVLHAFIADQIALLGRGESEKAFFNLIDLPHESFPLLQQKYKY